jgi:hypothetical protein
MVIDFRNIILIQSQSPLDSYSLNHMSSTKKYHPDSKSITIRLLQSQSRVASLRNIMIQSLSPLDSYSLNHMPLH